MPTTDSQGAYQGGETLEKTNKERRAEYDAKVEEYKAVEANIQELVKTLSVGYFSAEIVENIRRAIELLSKDLDYLGDVLTTLEDLGQRLTI